MPIRPLKVLVFLWVKNVSDWRVSDGVSHLISVQSRITRTLGQYCANFGGMLLVPVPLSFKLALTPKQVICSCNKHSAHCSSADAKNVNHFHANGNSTAVEKEFYKCKTLVRAKFLQCHGITCRYRYSVSCTVRRCRRTTPAELQA